MIKFALVLQICHAAFNVCLPPVSDTNFIYNSYKECAINGYSKGYDFMNELDNDIITEAKTFVRFWCEEKEYVQS